MRRLLGVSVVWFASLVADAATPPVPVPAGNPVTAAKAALGKALFWDEQLSSDNTVACGTCHAPDAGGADARRAPNPGVDGVFRTPDDVFGSPGVIAMDALGAYVGSPVFGVDPQVTGRASQSVLGGLWAPLAFWDGRAGGALVDPLSGAVVLPARAALESQALGPILNTAEMSHAGRDWDQVVDKLAAATPLALAADLTPDLADALRVSPTYPALFTAAFGDPAITPARIAMAIATYERTLVADQTPWDRFEAGDATALTAQQRRGWDAFRATTCDACHAPPLFTDDTFRNVGLRPIAEDEGRGAVTGDPRDDGRFKVPSLRNVGLKDSFMHNGAFTTLDQTVGFYVNRARQFPQNQDPLVQQVNLPPPALADVVAFLRDGLTDPRVAAGLPPFDAPRLHAAPDACQDGLDNDGDGISDLADPGCASGGDASELAWQAACDDGLDGDGDGLRDGADPDCDLGGLAVAVDAITAGRTATLTVAGGPRGGEVAVFLSTRGVGAGPCHPSGAACLDLLSPALLGRATIDAFGLGQVSVPVPASAPVGRTVWLRAVWVDGGDGDTSAVIAVRVQ